MPNDWAGRFRRAAQAEWHALYNLYLQSAEWHATREAALDRAGWKCQRCRAMHPLLEVHHKTYDRIGAERPADLEAVCPDCHKEADADRRWQTDMRRLGAWATKVYGPAWDNYPGVSVALEHFNRWLISKGQKPLTDD